MDRESAQIVVSLSWSDLREPTCMINILTGLTWPMVCFPCPETPYRAPQTRDLARGVWLPLRLCTSRVVSDLREAHNLAARPDRLNEQDQSLLNPA